MLLTSSENIPIEWWPFKFFIRHKVGGDRVLLNIVEINTGSFVLNNLALINITRVQGFHWVNGTHILISYYCQKLGI